MAVIPTGAPAWVRTNSHVQYGGDLNKRNYQSQGAVNGQTDVVAEEIARLAADMEALANVAPFAVMTYLANDTAPAAPTIESYDPMAGAPPLGVRIADGVVDFDWLASYTDPYNRSGSLHIGHAHAVVHGGVAAIANVLLSDPNADTLNERVRVFVRNTAGVPVADARVTLSIWTSVVP